MKLALARLYAIQTSKALAITFSNYAPIKNSMKTSVPHPLYEAKN